MLAASSICSAKFDLEGSNPYKNARPDKHATQFTLSVSAAFVQRRKETKMSLLKPWGYTDRKNLYTLYMLRELHPNFLTRDAAWFYVIPTFLVYFSWLALGQGERLLGISSLPIKALILVLLNGFILRSIWKLSRGYLRLTEDELQYWRPGDKQPIQHLSLKEGGTANIETFTYRQKTTYEAIYIDRGAQEKTIPEDPINIMLPTGRHKNEPEVEEFLATVNQEIKVLNRQQKH